MVTEGMRSIAGKGPRDSLARGNPCGVAAAAACTCAIGAMLSGCTLITDSFLTNEFSGDPYPINVETSSGAIVVGMRQADAEDLVAVIDLLSPITVVDQDPGLDPSLSYADLMLLGAASPGGPFDPASAVPRARFPNAQLVALHPCADNQDDGSPNLDCSVGTPTLPRVFKGVLGADVLAGDAVRLRLGDDQIFVLADVGGNDRGRSLDCDAVFDSPYRGGGTLVFPTTELAFGNRRITLRACLDPGPDPDPAVPFDPTTLHQRGTDALFVVSTSIGISILGAAAYQRYVIDHPEAKPLDPMLSTVYLPSGPVSGHRTTIDQLALVAASSSSNALAPCRQVYAHRLLSNYRLTADKECISGDDGTPPPIDCPCKDGSDFCTVPAILELTSGDIDVLVVDDTDLTLQALRTELRPDQPEVDGILGTSVLRGAEIDVDYPHDRLLARCAQASCIARPQLARTDDICQINRCITGLGDNAPGCSTPLPSQATGTILPN
jgi:hypothetical protein